MAAESHYDRTLSAQSEAQLRYDLLSGGDRDAAAAQLERRHEQAGSARQLRRIMWGSLGAVWALNVLDAAGMGLAPEGPARVAAGGGKRPGLFAGIAPDGVRLGVRGGF